MKSIRERCIIFGVLSACALIAARPAGAQVVCRNTPEGRICSTRQPLVGGAPVPPQTQRELGLVTVGGGCSGTLLNRFWVLTADHCVTTNGVVNGPDLIPTITAAWSPERGYVVR